MPPTDETPTTGGETDHPGFASERLALDVETVAARVHETLGDVSATRTDEGMKFRTPDGTLVAILTPEEGSDDPAVRFYYRTEPASESGALKAQRLWRALEADAV
ncbi:hypothetical protein N0B31_21220 [Salinirubellus salinus]|uniref:Uncharacterized protein n=1 Tax=Salinirubellus salinus TaxID=1364945 RepID=A0A9E7R378_9EURY|nr:hypothetical protein [Salinirubellus salinus]UWM54628.1 hypothetical protein N0B31_21220 [Salinirubellus salinus]